MNKTTRRLIRAAYRLLPVGTSTRLACSWVGRILVPRKQGLRVWDAEYGLRLKLTCEEAASNGIQHLGCIHPVETQLVSRLMASGGAMLDIGASVDGWHGLVAARAGAREVWCFEPIPWQFLRLEENINLNALGHKVRAVRLALADHDGLLTLRDEGSNSRVDSVAGFVKAPCMSLDHWAALNLAGRISLVKIDAEACELPILRGATNTLDRTDYLLVEVCEEFQPSGPLVAALTQRGFCAYGIGTDGALWRWSTSRPSKTLNVLFARADRPL